MTTMNEIDFVYWAKFRVVPLGTAVLLAIGVNPTGLDLCDDESGPFSKLTLDDMSCLYGSATLLVHPCNLPPLTNLKQGLYDLALSNINSDPDLKSYENPGMKAPLGMPFVNLGEFGSWVRRVGFKVPDDFPQSYVTSHINSEGKIFIEVPYKCEFMEDLARIMFKNYSNIPEGETPNQKSVALEIDQVTGWKNQLKGEKGSRTAVALASRLQPSRFQKD